MSYSGYLIKFGSVELPMEYIAEESYSATPNQRQELDAYRDNEGVLQREVAPNKPTSVRFSTIDGMTNTQVAALFGIFHTAYSNEAERKLSAVYYNPETDSYSQAEDLYLADTEFPIDYIDNDTNTVYYKPISVIMTGY